MQFVGVACGATETRRSSRIVSPPNASLPSPVFAALVLLYCAYIFFDNRMAGRRVEEYCAEVGAVICGLWDGSVRTITSMRVWIFFLCMYMLRHVNATLPTPSNVKWFGEFQYLLFAMSNGG